MKIYCIMCEVEVENWAGHEECMHPLDGTQFRTYGHYGSAVFDPMDGSYADVCICNTCLADKQHLMIKRRTF